MATPTVEAYRDVLGHLDEEQVKKLLAFPKPAKAWPYAFPAERDLAGLRAAIEAKYQPGEKGDGEGVKRHKVAGRLRAKRLAGGIAFLVLEGERASIQAILQKDEMGEAFDQALHLVSEGDWVGVAGYPMRSKRGEPSIGAEKVELLAKALVPFPDLRTADNPELRYGKPYVNLMQGPAERKVILDRARITQAVRQTLEKEGFIEAAIPVLERVYGGANAQPFTTHSNAKGMTMYLRISHELALKKLLVGGIERVYHIGPAFRNEDIDTTHNPEFTLMECYAAFQDYSFMMRMTEGIVRNAAKAVHGEPLVRVKDPSQPDGVRVLDLGKPFARVTMKDAIRIHSAGTPEAQDLGMPEGIRVDEVTDAQMQAILDRHRIHIRGGYARGLGIAKLFEHFAEPKLVEPTFVIDHPRETTPLCKQHRKDPTLVERFELFLLGREHANAYSELNDPFVQASLFAEQERRRSAGDEEAPPTDQDFIEALKHAMPPAAGLGIGIDRLVMTLLGIDSIKQVLPFPQVK
ncbi:MAG TPA: lysine--tRNA ligase [Candidatus Thermoplasmatota archaeon]|nr:lysine--tRNA ligase [Candidatus Thermoplasmatota archaeon]